VQGVRTWIGATDMVAKIVVSQLEKYPTLSPYYGVHTDRDSLFQLTRVPRELACWMGNEPDIGTDGSRMTPLEYVAWANNVRPTVEARGLIAYWGSISNLNSVGLSWLREVRRLAPWMKRFAIHRYNWGEIPNVQASSWGTRTNEMRELFKVLGNCPFRVGEIGCACGPKAYHTHRLWWKVYHPFTEQQQWQYLHDELAQWQGIATCEAVYVYQENSDGPNDLGLNGPPPANAPRQAWEVYA
jgi:hypothetical protein